MPTDIAALVVGVPTLLFVLRASLFVLQWLLVTGLEADQYTIAKYGVELHTYLFNRIRSGIGLLRRISQTKDSATVAERSHCPPLEPRPLSTLVFNARA